MTLEERLEKQWEQLKGTEHPAIVELDQDDHEHLPLLDVVPDFAITLSAAKERILMLQTFVAEMMVPGIDYGYIPGCQKPSLFKPGAEKLCDIFGFSKQIAVIDRLVDWEKGMFAYEVKATLINKRTGLIEAEGIGSCNSLEKKYKQQDGYTISNTVLKMAKKRALVDAVLSATRSSAIFTQDVEDLDMGKAKQASIQQEPTKNRSQENKPSSQEIPKVKMANEKQLGKIYYLVKEMGMPTETARLLMQDRYGVTISKDLSSRQASDFIQHLMDLNG